MKRRLCVFAVLMVPGLVLAEEQPGRTVRVRQASDPIPRPKRLIRRLRKNWRPQLREALISCWPARTRTAPGAVRPRTKGLNIYAARPRFSSRVSGGRHLVVPNGTHGFQRQPRARFNSRFSKARPR